MSVMKYAAPHWLVLITLMALACGLWSVEKALFSEEKSVEAELKKFVGSHFGGLKEALSDKFPLVALWCLVERLSGIEGARLVEFAGAGKRAFAVLVLRGSPYANLGRAWEIEGVREKGEGYEVKVSCRADKFVREILSRSSSDYSLLFSFLENPEWIAASISAK